VKAELTNLALWILAASAGYADPTGRELQGEMETLRDWQVENPLTSGITKGLSLGAFPSSRFGEGAVIASEHDPFGMPRAVYRQVAAHGRMSNQLGQWLGFGFWAFAFGGVFYRLLHKLKVDALERTNAG